MTTITELHKELESLYDEDLKVGRTLNIRRKREIKEEIRKIRDAYLERLKQRGITKQ